MPGSWKRPSSVAYPSVWSRFQGRRELEGHVPTFWVQDLPPDMFEEAIDTMCSNFIYDEPLCKYSGVAEDELSVQEIKDTWRMLVQDRVALVCFMENPDPEGKPIMAGLNMTYISQKDDKMPEFKASKWLKVFDTVMYLCKQKDAFTSLDIGGSYLGAFGLSVLPQYRGQGLGLALLEARRPLCLACGVRASLTVFTATASQRLADKAGFKDLVALGYEEIAQREPRFSYPGITKHTRDIRYMYIIYQ